MPNPFSVAKDTILFSVGQPCPGFVLLSKGTIKVTLTGASGKEVVLYRVTPGDVCLQTLTCLTLDETYSAEGVAETALEGEIIPAPEFQHLMAEDGGFRDRIMGAVAARFGEYQRLVEDVALTGFDARLARALLRLADASGVIRASHNDLAAETASGRAYVTRRLQAFGHLGLVQQEANGIVIRDQAALQQLSLDSR